MIDPAFAAVLRSRYTIRRFFLVYGIVLICALLALWGTTKCLDVNSTLRAVATGFLGNFAAADAIFLLAYGFYLFITPPGLRNADLIPLRSGEIADEITCRMPSRRIAAIASGFRSPSMYAGSRFPDAGGGQFGTQLIARISVNSRGSFCQVSPAFSVA